MVLKFILCWLEFYRDDFTAEDITKLRAFVTPLQSSYFAPLAEKIISMMDRPAPKLLIEKFSAILANPLVKELHRKDGTQQLQQVHSWRIQYQMFCLYLGKLAAPKSVLLARVQYEPLNEFMITPSDRQLQYFAQKSLQEAKYEQLANLIHYFLYETYRNIHPRELIGALQSKPETQKLCPNVTLHIRRTNIINHYVAIQILKEEKRVTTYELYINVAQRLRELNNYDAAMAVINGLTWAPVERLNLYNELSGKMQ